MENGRLLSRLRRERKTEKREREREKERERERKREWLFSFYASHPEFTSLGNVTSPEPFFASPLDPRR